MCDIESLFEQLNHTLRFAPTSHYTYFKAHWKLITERLNATGYSHFNSILTLHALLPHHRPVMYATLSQLIATKFEPSVTANFFQLYKSWIKEALGDKQKKAA